MKHTNDNIAPDRKGRPLQNTKKITPLKAQQILQEDGMEVSIEEAELMLDFMVQLAGLVVNWHINRATPITTKDT